MASAKVSVWWDIENCPVPRNVDPYRIAQNLSATLRHGNLEGPVTINTFGDTNVVKKDVLQALSSTGINVNHVPSGNKDAADKAILVGMLFWALENPPPAHFLLISGDVDFANALHRLRMQRYNVLLVRPDQHVKPALLGAATSVWYWTSVAEGRLSAFEHVEKTEEPLSNSTLMKKQLIDGSLHHQRSEEPVYKSTSIQKQPVDSSLDRQRAEPISSKRSSGCSLFPLPESSDSAVHETQDQRFNGGSFPNSLQCPESAAEVSSNVMKLKSSDEKERKEESVMNVCKKPTRHMRPRKHVHVCLYPKRRQVPRVEANLSEGTPVELVEDNTSNNALCATTIQKYQAEFSVNKSQFHPAHMPFSGDWESAAPPVPMITQPYDLADMQPCVSDSLLRSPFLSSDAILDFVHNEAPISKPIAKEQPSSQSKNPRGLAQETLDTYRSSFKQVREALETLKREGLLPTEANLQDCMCYWNKEYDKVKLKQILDKAIELQEITLMSAGSGSLRIFLPLNTTLWDCVNTGDMLYEYHHEIWMDFCLFLHSVESRQLIAKFESKYEAAQILKNEGPVQIKCLSIGRIVHILQQSIQKKRWLQFHGSLLFPLSVNLQVVTDYIDSLPNTKLNLQPWVCNNEKEASADNSYRQRATAVSPDDSSRKQIIIENLKFWLAKTLTWKCEYDISLVPKDFEQATGIHLDHKDLGYSRLKDLIQEFSDIVLIKKVRKGLDTLCPVVHEVNFKPVSSKCTIANQKSSIIDTARTVLDKEPMNTFRQSPLVQGRTLKKKTTLKKPVHTPGAMPKGKACQDIHIHTKKENSNDTAHNASMHMHSTGTVLGKQPVNTFRQSPLVQGLTLKKKKKKATLNKHVHTPGDMQKGKVCQDVHIHTQKECSKDTVHNASMHMHSTGPRKAKA